MRNGDISAFPNQGLGTDGLPSHEPDFGVTKREYFAAKLMAGIVHDVQPELADLKVCAEVAVQGADALLAALERTHA